MGAGEGPTPIPLPSSTQELPEENPVPQASTKRMPHTSHMPVLLEHFSRKLHATCVLDA